MRMRNGVTALGAFALAILGGRAVAQRGEAARKPAAITVDYPLDGSVFPPDFPAPLVLWRDEASRATTWTVEATFADGGAPIRVQARGERMRVGPIDPRCVSSTNAPPALTAEQAAARTWRPDVETWRAIRQRSASASATLRITGYLEGSPRQAVSRGQVTIRTSTDPVGAPIFYRDVPLMPSETEKGVIKPLAAERHSADRLAPAQRRRDQQPPADGGPAHLRQLPLLLARRQDAGHGCGWPAERQGAVRPGRHQARR